MSARTPLHRVVAGFFLAVAVAAVWLTSYFWPGAASEREIVSFLRGRAQPGDLVVVIPALSLDRLRAYTRAGFDVVSADSDRVLIQSGYSRGWIVGPLGGAGANAATLATARGSRALEEHLVAKTLVRLVAQGEPTEPRGRP